MSATQLAVTVAEEPAMSTRSIEASSRAGAVTEEPSSEPAASPHLQAQQLLNQFYARPRLAEHGQSDAETRQALSDFQHTRGLEPTGLPDQATLDELGRAIAWQAHEEAALAQPEPAPLDSSRPGLGVGAQRAIPPHLSHLADPALVDVTLPPARRMSNEELQRVAAGLSERFDAEPDPKVRRQQARQLLRLENELARRVASAPRDATELPVLRDVEWDAGSPNAGIVGDLHPFQNHDLWVAELARGPRGIRPTREPSAEVRGGVPGSAAPEQEAPPRGGTEPDQPSERVLDGARDVGVEDPPAPPSNDLQQGVGTGAGLVASAANAIAGSALLAGGEAVVLIAGTINSLKNAGDVREARGEIRGVMMATHLFDARGRIGADGRVSRQTMESFIQARYGREIAADVVTGAGADGPRRIATGRRRGIENVRQAANEVLRKIDEAYGELSAADQAAVDLHDLREEGLAELQRRTFAGLAPHARRFDVGVN